MDGVEISLRASKISMRRGRPCVTDTSATPAKWNTLSVICVPGSPKDSAVKIPIAIPGLILAASYSSRKYSSTFLVCSLVKLRSFASTLSSSISFFGILPSYSLNSCSSMLLTYDISNSFLDADLSSFTLGNINTIVTVLELHDAFSSISDCSIIFNLEILQCICETSVQVTRFWRTQSSVHQSITTSHSVEEEFHRT